MNEKGSASAQIIYHYSTLPGSISGIVIYIFLPQGRMDSWNILITYTHDGEINHNPTSTHNRGKARDK